MCTQRCNKEHWVSSLPEEDKYRFINKKCVDKIIPQVLRKVLQWGCLKNPSQSFTEYIESKHKCKSTKLFRYYERELEKTITDSYDACMLYDIIPFACDGISKTGSVEWVKAKEDPANIEFHLYKVKSLRNSVIHYPETEGVSKVFISEIGAPIEGLIKAAAKKFNKTDEEAQDFISEITEEIRAIDEGVMSCREREITAVLRSVRTEGRKEIKENCEAALSEELLPFSKVKVPLRDVFHSPKLINEDTQTEVSCEGLFAEGDDNRNGAHCLVVQGAAGAGKSTLLRRIALDFFEIPTEKEIFRDLRLFSVLLRIECRKSNVLTLGQLVRECFPKTLKPFTDLSQDAVEAILNTKALTMIDGIDDLTSSSKDLVKEVLRNFKGSEGARLVVTTRPSAAKEFVLELEKHGVSYQSFSIKEISSEDEQLKFLQRYERVIPHIGAPKLIEAFQSLQSAKCYFIYPVYLSLFCHLFRKNRDGIRCLTSPENLMEQTLRIGEAKALQRVSEHVHVNSEIVTNMICEKIFDLSLRCLHLGEHRIDAEAYKDFCHFCFTEISKVVPYTSVMSCLMTAKKSQNDPNEVSFEWFHKTFAEYLASKSLTTRILRSRKEIKILELMSEIIGMNVCETDLKRYQNVVLFCVLYFNTDARKRQLRGSLPQLLQLLSATATSARDWIRIVRLWPHSEEVATTAAKSAAISSAEWKVQDPNECEAVSRMLHHQEPLILNVALPRSSSPPPCILANIGQFFRGTLKLDLHRSHATFSPCDDLLLHNFKNARCGLVQFRGCLGTREGAAEALGLAVDEAGGLPWTMQGWVPELHISLLDPQNHHLFKYLNYRNHTLETTVIHPTKPLTPRPLPTSSLHPPSLTVHLTPRGGADLLLSLINALVPEDKRYSSIQLQQCGLSDAELSAVLDRLSYAGVRTDGKVTKFTVARMNDGKCSQCRRVSHDGEQRCLSLFSSP